MLKDIPYNELKKDKRAYEIMLLRDQYGNTFSDIASVYEISVNRAREIYRKLKFKQVQLYTNQIAFALGHPDTVQIMQEVSLANRFYWDKVYVCAYLEKTYPDILTEYRNGEPGMPEQFLKALPPLRKRLTPKEITLIVEMRETGRVSFSKIAKVLHITPEKARHAYNDFYRLQVAIMVKALQKNAKSEKEKMRIWEDCFRMNLSSKKRYEILCEHNGLCK